MHRPPNPGDLAPSPTLQLRTCVMLPSTTSAAAGSASAANHARCCRADDTRDVVDGLAPCTRATEAEGPARRATPARAPAALLNAICGADLTRKCACSRNRYGREVGEGDGGAGDGLKAPHWEGEGRTPFVQKGRQEIWMPRNRPKLHRGRWCRRDQSPPVQSIHVPGITVLEFAVVYPFRQ